MPQNSNYLKLFFEYNVSCSEGKQGSKLALARCPTMMVCLMSSNTSITLEYKQQNVKLGSCKPFGRKCLMVIKSSHELPDSKYVNVTEYSLDFQNKITSILTEASALCFNVHRCWLKRTNPNEADLNNYIIRFVHLVIKRNDISGSPR